MCVCVYDDRERAVGTHPYLYVQNSEQKASKSDNIASEKVLPENGVLRPYLLDCGFDTGTIGGWKKRIY